MPARATFVIAGASLAGAKAAEALRGEGFEGRIVLVGEEAERPYERPPLSKEYLRGEVGFDKVAVHDEGFYEENQIELVTSTRVAAVDPAGRTVHLEPGGRLGYDQLLLATGATPRTLAVPGADRAGIHYLRSLASCDALASALAESSRVVVVGAGWIGSEVAASARQMGKQVALVDPSSVPLERVLGTEVGAMFRDLHAGHGVELHLGVGVESFAGGERAEAVALSDGTSVAGDVFVVGVGARPRTELAEAAGLVVGDGIETDALLRTSAEGVWAAGDVAGVWYPGLGRRIRLEHWSAALNQGPAAARNMVGRQVAYTKVPYFYSDQFDLGMEYRGVGDRFDQVVYRGDREAGAVVVFWLDRGRVVAAMNVNVWDQAKPLAALVEAKAAVDPAALADPGVDLSSMLAP